MSRPAEGSGVEEVRDDPSRPPDPVLSDLSDGHLIDRSLSAALGDSRAFDELVRRHQGHIRANCRFIVDDPEAVLDLAQEVFVKAYFALTSFEGRSSFRTWLRRIKVNQCLSYRESRQRRTELRLHESRPEDDPALRVSSVAQEAVESGETRDRVTRTLDKIPESLRIPLVLRDMDGFSYQEIQGMLNIGLSAVKMRILRGREAFREAWAEEESGVE
ncbi:MAG: RNA polymerase sigma factor [Gemmatimonadota bacterium]